MKAEIIAVGSELLTPDRLDTNSLFLTEELNKLGIEVLRKTIVGDNRELLGRRLQRNDEVVRAIEARFRSFKRDMPAVNLRQAMVPEGAEVLENPRGTAPGLWLEDQGRMVALLPGPPRELKPLFLEQVLPRLRRRVSGVRMFHRELRITGLGESHVEERVRPIYTRYSDVNTTILAAPGEVQIHLRVWSDDAAQTNTTLDEMVRSFELALGDRIFAHSAVSL